MRCGDFSITSRARLMGFLMCFRLPTAPALSVLPSMMDASISFVPALVKTEPRPALKRGSSSSTRTAASVASRLDPPRLRISYPVLNACSSPPRYSRSFSGVMLLRSIVPAPPWIANPVFFVSIFLLFSARFSARGVADRSTSPANPNAAAVKNIQAKKQLGAQALAILMEPNVTRCARHCRRVSTTVESLKTQTVEPFFASLQVISPV